MEQKRDNSLIIILAIIFIGVGGYLFYNKNYAKDTKNKADNSKIEEVETKKEIKQATQVINTKVGTFIISKDGSVYYRKTVDKFAGVDIIIDDSFSIGTHGNFEVEDYITGLEYDEELQQAKQVRSFEGYKLDLQNVNSAYEIMIGNGGTNEIIYFLSNDGKVNELSFDSNGTVISINLQKNTSSYPNIVSVLQTSGFDASNVILVDKEGNKYTDYKN